MIRTRTIQLALVFALLLPCIARADAWSQQRERVRQERWQLQVQAAAARAERAAAARTVIIALIETAERTDERGVHSDLWPMLAGLRRMERTGIDALVQRVRQLSATGEPSSRWSVALADARAQLVAAPQDLLRRAADVGAITIARDALHEVLHFDPDHAAVRKGLGQVRLKDSIAEQLEAQRGPPAAPSKDRPHPELDAFDPDARWFSPFDAEMLGRGLVWDESFGWIYARHRDRYAHGYVYDFQEKQWRTLAEANADHARPGHDWILRTEHLEIRGTADLQTLARCATELERFYDEIFATYAAFFADSHRHNVLRLAMGLEQHRPLKVRILADAQQYQAVADGPRWSGGLYRPDEKTSYFYGRPSTTMFHEFTHQILHEFTGRNESPSWLTEAIAQYTETVRMGQGSVTFTGARYTDDLSVSDLLTLRSGHAWDRHQQQVDRGNAPSAYAAAGSLATFCMHADDGRYAPDFIDYVRDAYRGLDRGRDVWEYLGLTERDFVQRYMAWGARSAR